MFIIKWGIKCSECGRPDRYYPGDAVFVETKERAEWCRQIFMEGASPDDKELREVGREHQVNLIEAFKKPLGAELLESARKRAPTSCGLKVGEGVSNKHCNMVFEFNIEEVPTSGNLCPGSDAKN